MLLNFTTLKNLKLPLIILYSLVFILICFRNYFLKTPIFGGDEYAYFIHALYSGVDLSEFDPLLQHTNNLVFFRWLNLFLAKGHVEEFFIFKTIHLIEWFLIVFLIYFTFCRSLKKTQLHFSSLLTLFLPSSIYISTLMPDIELTLVVVTVVFLISRMNNKNEFVILTLIAFFSALGILIKPNAIILMCSSLFFILVKGYIVKIKNSLTCTSFYLLFFIFIWFVSLFFLMSVLSNSAFSLSDAFSLKFYSFAISMPQGGSDLFTKLEQMLKYLFSHLLILFIIFPLSIYFIIQSFIKIVLPNQYIFNLTKSESYVFLFLIILFIADLFMISIFSVNVSNVSYSESSRLHGRYLLPLIVYMPVLTFYFINKIRTTFSHIRFFLFFNIAALFLFIYFVKSSYKIYPWDYPELFVFFSEHNFYNWTFSSPSFLSFYLIIFILLFGFLFSVYRPNFFKFFSIINLCILLIFGNLREFLWAKSHLTNNSNAIFSGQFFNRSIESSNPGDGLFIGNERYGSDAYFLLNFSRSPYIFQLPSGYVVDQSIVKEFKWVVMSNDYVVKFPYKSSLRYNNYGIYFIH
jgi:hypothetical protein